MVLPLVGVAAGIAARAAAKKAAQTVAKKAVSKNVKVKPAAKNKPNPPSAAKLMMKEMRSERGESRKASIQIKNLPKRSNAATQPSNWGSGAEKVKINSSVKSQTADQARSNAKALKAANKPVSKNNRDVGGPLMRDILKRATPARANRTRSGNPAKKK